MFLIVKLIFICMLLLLFMNDMMHNTGKKIWLKFLEFLACIALIIYASISVIETYPNKNNTQKQEKNFLDKKIIYYNEEGIIERESTIGEFLKNELFINILETKLDKESPEYIKGNVIIGVTSGILVIYWIVLLLLFEKEEVNGYTIIEDEAIFEKYNPMLAACIAQNRNIMCRDFVGVILNLINKGKIKIRNIPDKSIKNIGYRYRISENNNCNIRLDPIEDEIYNWIFKEYSNLGENYIRKNEDGVREIDFIKRLEEISLNEETYKRLKRLNGMAKRRLNNIGANKESVPIAIKIFNNILFCVSLFLIISHIVTNLVPLQLTNLHYFCYMIILVFVIFMIPIIYAFSLICLTFIHNVFKTLQQITEGYTGRLLVAKSVSIILAIIILVAICAICEGNSYMIYDILLLGITFLIISTDDYMIKHDYKILNDYYNLKRIEQKISESSLIEYENIEYLKLWDKYYAYAVAFGIPIYVNKELNISYENLEILTSQNLEGIFYVCKSYLDVMWNMDFDTGKSKIDIFKILQ